MVLSWCLADECQSYGDVSGLQRRNDPARELAVNRGSGLGEFRAIILNNCSTDETLQVAQRFCEEDARFSVISNETHLSAEANFAIGREARR